MRTAQQATSDRAWRFSRLAARESRIPLAELITGLAASAARIGPPAMRRHLSQAARSGHPSHSIQSSLSRSRRQLGTVRPFTRHRPQRGIFRSRGSQITFDIGIGPRIEDRGTDLIRTKALKPLSYLARNWKFESTPLQQTVGVSPSFSSVRGKARSFRGCAGCLRGAWSQRRAGLGNIAPRGGIVSVGRYSSTAVLPMRFATVAALVPKRRSGCIGSHRLPQKL